MMRKLVTVLVMLLFTSSAAFANSDLERMEELSEELNTLMYTAMLDEMAAEGADVSKLRAMIPETKWNEPIRQAAQCVLDKYEDKIGKKGVTKMLDDLEAALPALNNSGGTEAFESIANLQPEGISDEETIALQRECGMVEQIQKQMMKGEFMTELMKLMSQG